MLDTDTLFVALIPVLLAGLVAHLANGRIHRESAALRWWGRGMMLQVAGVGIIIFHPLMPLTLAVFLSTLALTGGQCLILHGMAIFARRPVRPSIYLGVAVFVLAGVGYWTLAADVFAYRYAVFSAASVFLGGLVLARLVAAERRVGTSSIAVLFAVISVSMVAMAWSALVLVLAEAGAVPSTPPEGAMQGTMLAAIGLIILAVFGFVLLTSGEAQAELKRLAMTDQLTGLPNRRGFESRMARRKEPRGSRLAMAILDIDHFKAINDSRGHEVGDRTLEEVGRALSASLREGDFAARIGGEEFVLILTAQTEADALAAVERARKSVGERSREPGASGVPVTLSAGLALAPERLADAGALYRTADKALYQAKQAGRDRTVLACADEAESPEPHAVEAASQDPARTVRARTGRSG